MFGALDHPRSDCRACSRRGDACCLGGVTEAVRDASHAGMTEILLPPENEVDLDDIALEMRRSLAYH
jgi:ATP-dependent Lon protease